MAIADDYELHTNEADDTYVIEYRPGGPGLIEFYDFMHESMGHTKVWIAVNDCYEYKRMRTYGVNPPNLFQRLWARLRGWHIMRGWEDPDPDADWNPET